MLPFEGASLESVIANGGISPVIPSKSPDSLLPKPAALQGTLNDLGEKVCDHLGTAHAKGDNIALTLGNAEVNQAKAPTFTSELQLKEMGLRSGGAEQGG